MYKARLGDYDVAVKVIEHYSSMSAAVQNEATLMLSCRHPNVVAAYHYITKNHSQLGTGTGATGDSSDASFCTAVERVLLSSITDHQQQQGGSGGNGAAVAAGTGGSIEHPSRGSNNSMDKPIPVLPGLKIVRKAYQASELEVWPSSSSAPQQQEQPHTDDFLTNSSSVNAAPLYASSSSLASSGGTGGGGTAGDQRHQQPQQQQSQQGVAQGRDSSSSGVVEAVESSLLKWQNEGGFWPAGPSALLEQQQHPVDDEADDSLVTTWLIQVRTAAWCHCQEAGGACLPACLPSCLVAGDCPPPCLLAADLLKPTNQLLLWLFVCVFALLFCMFAFPGVL